jgi:SecD/SecF fusion protein
MHDLLITAGVYALLGLEVTTATVAALLTILGYSLYDTIIVFDRVRENVPRMPRAAFSQILNRSMSEVLMRSLATSFCTLLPILALLFFGGETLADFALALVVGVVSGTYSSIFIATPVLMHWKEGEGVWRSRRGRIAAANDGVVPPYATAAGGAETEVEVVETKKPRGRLTAPEDPERAVSSEDFNEMVKDLHGDASTATEDEVPPAAPAASSGADALPEDLVLKDETSKPKDSRRKRNKKHGRR